MSTSWLVGMWRAIIPAPDPLPPEDTADRPVRRWRRLIHIGSWLVAGYLFLFLKNGDVYTVDAGPMNRVVLALFAAAPIVLCRRLPMVAWLSWLVALAIVWTFMLRFPPTLCASRQGRPGWCGLCPLCS